MSAAHKWISTPFQLVFWQVLLAAVLLSAIAWFAEGAPRIVWTARLAALMLYSGIVCTAFANWAMTMVNRSLPAVTTSLCLLATPLLGIVSATVMLNEPLEPSLFRGDDADHRRDRARHRRGRMAARGDDASSHRPNSPRNTSPCRSG